LKEYVHSTSGADSVSVAIYHRSNEESRNTFNRYIINSIAFVISPPNLQIQTQAAAGMPLVGEIYVMKSISVDNIIFIYIPTHFEHVPLSQLDLSSLDYGSAEIETKLNFYLGAADHTLVNTV
jgi:hypothetical protein